MRFGRSVASADEESVRYFKGSHEVIRLTVMLYIR
jgi:hypothetical protein